MFSGTLTHPPVGFPLRVARLAAALLACSLPALYAAAGQQAADAKQAAKGQEASKPKQKKDASVRLAEEWLAPDKMKERRDEALNRPLFKTHDLLAFTLAADFKTINRDRVRDSPKRYPGVLTVAGAGGKTESIPVEIGTRGNLRLNVRTCDFVPLRIVFPPKTALKGSLFEGQSNLKLITHCQNDNEYEQYVLAEYLAYRIFNAITPLSYRARLAKATYVDSTTGKTITSRHAAFVERDDDVAHRVEGRIIPLQKRLFSQLDPDSLTMMALFHYMIANTDYSIYNLHNVRLVQDRAGAFHTITYDFDLSGLVNARYAIPDKSLGIQTVRDRRYRGPCRTVEEYEPYLARFRAKKAEVLALFDLPDLEKNYRREAKGFIEDFFSAIDKKGDVKHDLVDRCPKKDGM